MALKIIGSEDWRETTFDLRSRFAINGLASAFRLHSDGHAHRQARARKPETSERMAAAP